MKESSVEDRLFNLCKQHNIFITKQTGMNGIPDRLLLYDGRSWYVELKKPGEKPTALQRAVAKKIRDHGGVALWADSYETVDRVVTALVTNSDPPRDRYIPNP